MRLLLALAAIGALASTARADDPKIKFEKFTLPNGLEVILAPDPSVPLVAVERLVPRRLGRRGAGQERLRAPVRAHDVPGLEERRRRQPLRDPAQARRRRDQRHDERRSHELLRGRPREPARDRAVARERSHGPLCSTSSTRASSTTRSTSCATSAARATTTCPTTKARFAMLRGALSRGAPLSLHDDRQARGSRRGVGRRRQALLQDLVRAVERDARAGRRLRSRRRQAARREVVRQLSDEHEAEDRDRPGARRSRRRPSRSTIRSRSSARSHSRGTRRRSFAPGDAELDIAAAALDRRRHGPALQVARLRQAARADGAREPEQQHVLRACSRSPSRCARTPISRTVEQIVDDEVAKISREPLDANEISRVVAAQESRARSTGSRSSTARAQRAAGIQPVPRRSGSHHVRSRSLSQGDRRPDPRDVADVFVAGARDHRRHEPRGGRCASEAPAARVACSRACGGAPAPVAPQLPPGRRPTPAATGVTRHARHRRPQTARPQDLVVSRRGFRATPTGAGSAARVQAAGDEAVRAAERDRGLPRRATRAADRVDGSQLRRRLGHRSEGQRRARRRLHGDADRRHAAARQDPVQRGARRRRVADQRVRDRRLAGRRRSRR